MKKLSIVNGTLVDDEANIIGNFDESIFLERLNGKSRNNSMCPKCGGSYIVKNGFDRKGKQRYLCKHCRTIFTDTSGTITSYTRKSVEVWIKYIQCMILAMPVRAISEKIGIHYNTAFQWRHKILHAMKGIFQDKEEGVAQVDEARFLVSYKGIKSNGEGFVMPRKPRRKSEKKYLFIEEDVVSVICSVDNTNNIICEAACVGRMTIEDIFYILKDNIRKGSIFCTNRYEGYNIYSKENNLIHILRRGTLESGETVNNIEASKYKANLTNFILVGFRGVATKYLSQYLLWFKWLRKNLEPQDLLAKVFFNLGRISIRELRFVKPAFACAG